ncbi:MAG TPA: FAD-binding oxidoreductase [Anaerolineae bacterium]|nr:FAD-binding oxidoreductase [Anaerolineae bacterium]
MPLEEVPYWWATAPELPRYTDRPLPARVDVAVIGSGYTGLSAARQLARSGAAVAVLEKETIGWGASSRNGGQVLTGLKVGAETLLKKFGRARARELYAASLAAIEYVENLIAVERIDCDYTRAGHLEAAFKPAHFEHFKRVQEVLAREFAHPVRLLTQAEQAGELGSDYYHGLLVDERSGGLHPARYVRGLALAAERAGANLHEKTPALRIDREGAGFKVTTGRGVLSAQAVLVATNGYTDAAMPAALRRRVIPIGSYIIATQPLTPQQAERILPRRRMVFDSKNFLYYFRLSSDNRLLFGGRAQFTPSTPHSTRQSAAILRRGMLDVFPDLADVAVDYVWSGNVCFTRDLFPHTGCLDGAHYALGYGGHGVALATYLGAKMAEVVLGQQAETPFRALPFDAIPLYTGRPWFLPVAAIWYKFLDWVQ